MKPIKIILFLLALNFVTTVFTQTVYTTKTGEKYHNNSCRYLKYSKKELTLERAKALGYLACSVCKPNANNTKSQAESTALTNSTTSSKHAKNATATQCTGKTKAGKRCKRRTKNTGGRCYQHN